MRQQTHPSIALEDQSNIALQDWLIKTMASYSKNAIYLILIIVVFTAFLGVIYSSLEIDNNNRGPLATEIFAASRNIFYPTATRLQQYCSIITPVRGSHSVDIHDSWELQYLTINIRHGDRTAINHIVGTSKNYGNMKGNNSYFIDEEALKHVYRLKAFDLDPLPRGQKLKHKPVSYGPNIQAIGYILQLIWNTIVFNYCAGRRT